MMIISATKYFNRLQENHGNADFGN